jgi:hypothetical protein
VTTVAVRRIFESGRGDEAMEAIVLFVTLAPLCIVWYLVSSIFIVNALQQRQVKINWFPLRMLLPSYAGRHRKLTREETGKTGLLFYHWIISINGTLVFAIITLLFKHGVLR